MNDTIDLDQANNFLNILDPEGQFTFQTFDDKGINKGLTKILHGQLKEVEAELIELNNLGAGVFVCINQTDLQGRKSTNIVRIRALFVDLDDAPLDPVRLHSIHPTMIVETSPSRWHCYWVMDDCPINEFVSAQEKLIKAFNGDPAVKDLPRVMRLPGFFHQKAEPRLVRIIYPEAL